MPQSYQPLTPSRPSSSSSNGSSRSRPSGGSGLKVSHGPKPRLLRRLDTICCNLITYFPLLIVYGATAWAVWVEAWSISLTSIGGSKGHFLAFVGVVLWFMLNWSYTIATFSSPGTPLETKNNYSHLPTTEVSAITVKSSGEERFCKKCQCRKPDRTHHCSTCNTCVLKMDHHCPWLANCLGISNYKCFVLFTFYLALFCLFSCAVSTLWLWEVIFKNESYTEVYMPVNWVLLAVISGVVGIVVAGFSGYHFMLVFKNETTIESLEKTRYLSPLKKRGIPLSAQFVGGSDGVLTPQAIELRERERYNEYIIEETSRAMPNAFDLGWKRNFVMVFGERRALWFVPVKNSIGDGWTWETSQVWKDAQREVAERRRQEQMAEIERMKRAGWGGDEGTEAVAPNGWNGGPGHRQSGGGAGGGHNPWTRQSVTGIPSPNDLGSSKASRILGAREEEFSHGLGGSRYSPKVNMANREVSVRMQDLKKKRVVMSRADLDVEDDTDDYDTSSDEGAVNARNAGESSKSATTRGTSTSESLNRKAVDTWSDGW